jgi:hypothetical protein
MHVHAWEIVLGILVVLVLVGLALYRAFIALLTAIMGGGE